MLDARAHDAKGDVAHDAAADVAHDAATDVLAKMDAPAPYPAMHPPMPQEVNSGGPVMTAPKFVVITFAGDTFAPNIDDFADKIAASATYWSGTTAEYGVGPIASVLHVSLNETPATALADTDVQTWLTQKLAAADAGVLEGGAPLPQPDGETVYMIYYPATVTVTQGGADELPRLLRLSQRLFALGQHVRHLQRGRALRPFQGRRRSTRSHRSRPTR